MTDNAEKLPDARGDLESTEVTEAAAAAIRGGAGSESQLLSLLSKAVDQAVEAFGSALNRAARAG